MRVRPRVQGVLEPIGRFLAGTGLPATAVTLFGFSVTVAGAVMIGFGLYRTGALVALLGSAIDGLDGSVARAAGGESARGAFLDSAVDRLGEIAVFAGLVGILLCAMLGGMRAVTWTQIAQYIVLIVAYLTPIVILSTQHYGFPIPELTYGQAIADITAL